MPTAEDFRRALDRELRAAAGEGLGAVEINAGELHRRVGGYPGPDHRMPSCCGVLRGAMGAFDRVVSAPAQGKGALLTIRYVLPRG